MDKVPFADLAETFHCLNDSMQEEVMEFEAIQSILEAGNFIPEIFEKIEISKSETISRKGIYYQFVI